MREFQDDCPDRGLRRSRRMVLPLRLCNDHLWWRAAAFDRFLASDVLAAHATKEQGVKQFCFNTHNAAHQPREESRASAASAYWAGSSLTTCHSCGSIPNDDCAWIIAASISVCQVSPLVSLSGPLQLKRNDAASCSTIVKSTKTVRSGVGSGSVAPAGSHPGR